MLGPVSEQSSFCPLHLFSRVSSLLVKNLSTLSTTVLLAHPSLTWRRFAPQPYF
jgi:hypothetical protein